MNAALICSVYHHVFASEKMYPAWEVFFFEKSFGCYLAVAWDIKREVFFGLSPKKHLSFYIPCHRYAKHNISPNRSSVLLRFHATTRRSEIFHRSGVRCYSTFTRTPFEWLVNSGAYMHCIVVMPLLISPRCDTTSGYSNTNVPRGR